MLFIFIVFSFSFQDRGKRLKLQQFIVKKASLLYDSNFLQSSEAKEKPVGDEGKLIC